MSVSGFAKFWFVPLTVCVSRCKSAACRGSSAEALRRRRSFSPSTAAPIPIAYSGIGRS